MYFKLFKADHLLNVIKELTLYRCIYQVIKAVEGNNLYLICESHETLEYKKKMAEIFDVETGGTYTHNWTLNG